MNHVGKPSTGKVNKTVKKTLDSHVRQINSEKVFIVLCKVVVKIVETKIKILTVQPLSSIKFCQNWFIHSRVA
jgi:hypothetical protein